jgi:hypothetical protein
MKTQADLVLRALKQLLRERVKDCREGEKEWIKFPYPNYFYALQHQSYKDATAQVLADINYLEHKQTK